MSLTLYEITIPVFIRELNILSKLLQLGVDHAKDSGNAVTEQSLVDARLIADMQTLAFQSMSLSPLPQNYKRFSFTSLSISRYRVFASLLSAL
jgi:hypothetical protein